MKRALLAAILAATLIPGAVRAERDMAKEGRIEQELLAINPALVAPFREARIAIDRSDYAAAARLLGPVCDAAPNFDAAQRRLGYALSGSGRYQEGILHGEKAVAIRRDAANLSSLATDVAFAPGHTATRVEKDRAYSLLQAAVAMPDGKDAGNLVAMTSLAFEVGTRAAARDGVEALQKSYPNLMQTHYFSAIVDVWDERWRDAKREILKAQAMGLPAEAVTQFLDSGVGGRAMTWQIVGVIGWSLCVWAVGIVHLCGLGFALSKMTLRQIEKGSAALPVSPAEHRLRRVYRWLLNLAGLYYYISLPVVLVLVIGVCAGLLYLFLSIGQIPIKLVLILIIGAAATIWSMVRSLFLRVASSDPGRPLARSDAEDLWRLTEEVAAELKTRPVDEIRITGGTDLCVYERGSWREKLQNRAKRILVLGTALLPDFRQEDFRCVLAHEYGHFSHRDTAGGDAALRVRQDMIKFYYAMRAAGQATKFNIAFQFLRLYNFIFRRISHGATRLQEVLADRVAARIYGAAAFEGGLSHVIRRSVAFNQRANHEIKEAIQGARPLRNLYELQAAEPATEEEAFQKAISRPTTEDDTHPGPKDRFRYIAGLTPKNPGPPTGVVWNLFRDPEALMREMVAEIEKKVAPHRN